MAVRISFKGGFFELGGKITTSRHWAISWRFATKKAKKSSRFQQKLWTHQRGFYHNVVQHDGSDCFWGGVSALVRTKREFLRLRRRNKIFSKSKSKSK